MMKFATIAKLATGLAAGWALAGCNMVVSEEPWFERTADSPMMKPGIWGAANKTDCEFDASAAVTDWPECADPAIIDEQGSFITQSKNGDGWKGVAAVLGGTDPMIVQFRIPEDAGQMAPDGLSYIYFAAHALDHDADGKITRMALWPVMCGPIDKDPPADGRLGMLVSNKPFAGLTIKDSNCLARDIPSLVGAAAKSEALQEQNGQGRWIRDVMPGELPEQESP
ncbi:MAG: hypothetical protein R3E18_02490 [Sphingomonadaceae bacterium]|nr:hypothetical protein [Sphingomonadaceae bacterium]